MSAEQRRFILAQRKLVQRIREEFEAMPRLRFTVDEAAGFWGIDEITCRWVLLQLTTTGFLAKGNDNRFEMLRRT